MPANSLLQKFIAPFVILLSGSLLAFSWWIQYSLEKHFEQTVEEDLIGRFELLAIQHQLLEEFVERGSSSEIFQAFAEKNRIHISILEVNTTKGYYPQKKKQNNTIILISPLSFIINTNKL